MTDHLPDRPVAATLHADNLRWRLHMHRDLPFAPPDVWEAITRADLLARWTPFRPDHDLVATGEVGLAPTDGSEEAAPGNVLEVAPPETLVFLWGTDLLRFDLLEAEGGTTLALAHTFDDRNAASSYAAGWHLCLGALELVLAGKEAPVVVGERAMAHGWPELNQRYATLFREQALA
jgi:uncharacterized protein YndB with AHSA1/START domain